MIRIEGNASADDLRANARQRLSVERGGRGGFPQMARTAIARERSHARHRSTAATAVHAAGAAICPQPQTPCSPRSKAGFGSRLCGRRGARTILSGQKVNSGRCSNNQTSALANLSKKEFFNILLE